MRAGDRVDALIERWVRIQRVDKVLSVVMDKPTKGNVLDLQSVGELLTALDDVDDDTGCVLIRAVGGNFCVGVDIDPAGAAADVGREYVGALTKLLHRVVRSILDVPTPVIAAVQGYVGGAGLGLVSACDVVLCGESVRFQPANVPLGLPPNGGVSWVLQCHLGRAKATELLLTDGVLTAVEAEAAGLVSRVLSDEQLVPEAEALAHSLAGRPSSAAARTCQLIRDAYDRSLREHLDAEESHVLDYVEERQRQIVPGEYEDTYPG